MDEMTLERVPLRIFFQLSVFSLHSIFAFHHPLKCVLTPSRQPVISSVSICQNLRLGGHKLMKLNFIRALKCKVLPVHARKVHTALDVYVGTCLRNFGIAKA